MRLRHCRVFRLEDLCLEEVPEVGRVGRSYSWKMEGNVNMAALNVAFLIISQCVHDAINQVHL